MTDQEILDSVPEGATHYDQLEYMRHVPNYDNWEYWSKAIGWGEVFPEGEIRSLADIKRIAELEKSGNEMAIIIAELRSEVLVLNHQVKRYKKGQGE